MTNSSPQKTLCHLYPRTTNSGYGPKNVQMLFDGVSLFQGTMAPTATLDVPLSPPVCATNAELYITSSYDPAHPTNSRNVQVVEMVFFERPPPGTFGDWAVQNFSDSQLADPTVSGPLADPDNDGAPNLMEFAMAGSPLVSDASLFKLQPISPALNQFSFSFRQRKDLGDVTRQFQNSTSLSLCSPIAPLNLVTAQDLGSAVLLQATFAITNSRSFYRLSFSR